MPMEKSAVSSHVMNVRLATATEALVKRGECKPFSKINSHFKCKMRSFAIVTNAFIIL